MRPGTGLVLGGGGARGAYEVGVLHHLFEDLRGALGASPRFSVMCGTSAGAINACALAAEADEPLRGVATLAAAWSDLRLADMLRVDRLELLGMIRGLLGGSPRSIGPCKLRGALLDPGQLRSLLVERLPLDAVARNTGERRTATVSVTTTDVASGGATLFVAGPGRVEPPPRRSTRVVQVDRLTPEHILASASTPFLLPPVDIDGRLHCDGSLRMHVPLSPALHLGAERLVVVSTQPEWTEPPPHLRHAREDAFPSPLFLLGRALEALTLDRIDDDLERLMRMNDIMSAGRRAFGDGFAATLNAALARPQAPPLRPVDLVVVRPSESLGRLAWDHVRSRRFRGRLSGPAGRLLARLADGDAEQDADLLSFLLFDGAYARELMELGREDARRRSDALVALLADGATQCTSVITARPG